MYVEKKIEKAHILLLRAYYFCFTTENFQEDLFKCVKSCPILLRSNSGKYTPLLPCL